MKGCALELGRGGFVGDINELLSDENTHTNTIMGAIMVEEGDVYRVKRDDYPEAAHAGPHVRQLKGGARAAPPPEGGCTMQPLT